MASFYNIYHSIQEMIMSDSDECKTSREKYWSELDEKGKIERMREELKRCVRRCDELEADVLQLKRHKHTADGAVVVSAFDAYATTGFPRSPRPSAGDDIYF